MKDISCDICQNSINPGDAFYTCSTEFISGFDGVIPNSSDPNQDIKVALEELKKLSAKEVMDDVYQRIELVLCPNCRTKLSEKIMSMIPQKYEAGKIIKFPLKKRS